MEEVSKTNKTLQDKRSARSVAVDALGFILSDLVRTVGKSASNEAQYKAFFDFNSLYPQPRDKKNEGEKPPTEQKQAA